MTSINSHSRWGRTLAWIVIGILAGSAFCIWNFGVPFGDMRGGFLHCLAWSPDSTQLAAAYGDGSIYIRSARGIWSGYPRCLTKSNSREYTNGLQWSPDGTMLLSRNEDGISVWRVADGRLLLQEKNTRSYFYEGSGNPPYAWSPDGRKLALLYGKENQDEHTLMLWSADQPDTPPQEVWKIAKPEYPDTVQWQPGTTIVSVLAAYEDTARMLHIDINEKKLVPFSEKADGNYSRDNTKALVHHLAPNPGGNGELLYIEVKQAPQMNTLYTITVPEPYVYYAIGGAEFQSTLIISWSPDSKRFALCKNYHGCEESLQVWWDAQSGRELGAIRTDFSLQTKEAPHFVWNEISPDLNYVAIGINQRHPHSQLIGSRIRILPAPSSTLPATSRP